MFRWPLLVLGIIIVILAQIMAHKNKPMDENSEKIDISKALEYIQKEEKRFVEIAAGIDTTEVIYATAVRKPLYTLKPTNKVYRLEDIFASGEYLSEYAGTVVSAGNVLKGESILLQAVSEKSGDNKEVIRERVLACVDGSTWILSPVFQKGDTAGRNAWIYKGNFKGGVIGFNDLKENVGDPPVENELDDIRKISSDSLGINIPDEAYIIIDGTGIDFIPAAFYQVSGSGSRIFYSDLPDSMHNEIKILKGILYPWDVKLYADFPVLLKKDLGNRIGVLIFEDPSSYNTRKENDVKETSTVGAILIIIALLGFLRKRIKAHKLRNNV